MVWFVLSCAMQLSTSTDTTPPKSGVHYLDSSSVFMITYKWWVCPMMASSQTCKSVQELFQDFTCLICHCVAEEPQQLTCECGRLYCKACLDLHFAYSNYCPQCRKYVQSFPDARSKREINQLKVECPNQESGCKWSGKLISLNEHISKDCQFRIVPCPNRCTLAGVPVMLLQQDVPVHITTVCSNRLINCPHCAKKVKHGELEAVHFGKCTKILIPCPNEGCTLTIERATLQTHRNSCEYESVPCKYAYIGCPAIVIRKDIETHENNYQIHLELALQTISKMKRESQRDHPLVEDDTTPTQLTGTGTEHPLAAVSTTQKDSASQTPDLLVFPNVRYGTVTTFKVNNFTHLKSTNQIHYSPPFYSHPGGYKLCVAVHANGTTAGHGSHLSLVVHVMHGENDRNLPWPFTGELVLELLNQDEDKYHYKKHLKFPSKLCDENTHVMTGNRNQSGFGYPKYIPHHVLQENVRPSYMANDTLFFRVSANATVRNSLKPWLTCTT